MTIPHITDKQYNVLHSGNCVDGSIRALNRLIDEANAEAEQSEQFITAAEARALGAGAEYYAPDAEYWITCAHLENFPFAFPDGQPIKYRVKQPKSAEPFDLSKIKGVGRDFEPAEPHAELKELYAQQVADGTLDNFVWEFQFPSGNWATIDSAFGTFHKNVQYRCIPKAKKVISWSQMPVGVRTLHGELRSVDKAGKNANIEILEVDFNDVFIQPVETRHLTLAPASEQKWIAVQDNQNIAILLEDLFRNGITTKMHHSAEKYRIVGIESGYVLGGN